jgi:hypothetical protein
MNVMSYKKQRLNWILTLLAWILPAIAVGLPSPPRPQDLESFKCEVCSSSYVDDWHVNRVELEKILTFYNVVTKQCWERNYSHIALNDQIGSIILKDGTKIAWMVRPGGLATLTFPDGGVIYLAKEIKGITKNCSGPLTQPEN